MQAEPAQVQESQQVEVEEATPEKEGSNSDSRVSLETIFDAYFIAADPEINLKRYQPILRRLKVSQGMSRVIKLTRVNGEQLTLWQEFFPQIKSIKAQTFDVFNCKKLSANNYIGNITFTHLQDLSLYGNKIMSLERFYHMDLPLLKNVRLDDNKLTNLRCLRKCFLPSLEQIDLEHNHWKDPQLMALMHAPRLLVVRLEEWTENITQNDDNRWFSRLQSPLLNYIRCPSQRRLKQPGVDSMLRRKYPSITIMRCNN